MVIMMMMMMMMIMIMMSGLILLHATIRTQPLIYFRAGAADCLGNQRLDDQKKFTGKTYRPSDYRRAALINLFYGILRFIMTIRKWSVQVSSIQFTSLDGPYRST